MRTRAAVALWTGALLFAAATVALVFTSDHEDAPVPSAILVAGIGLAFVGAGLVAWYRRPENRTGLLMTLVGFSWFLGALVEANDALPFTLGVALQYLAFGFFAHLLLAFPTGRLETVPRKVMVILAFLITTVARVAWMLFDDLRSDFPGAPANAFLIQKNDAAAVAIETTVQAVALGLIAGTLVVFARRWRSASKPLRRALAPVFATSSATVVILAVWISLDIVDGPGADVAWWLLLGSLATVPLSFLVGLLQTRLVRYPIGRLAVELGGASAPRALQEALRRAVGDPSLAVAYRVGGGYVDGDGRPVELPDESSGRVTFVEREGRSIAALVHDPSLRQEPRLLESVTAVAGLALENEQRLAALAQSEARNRALVDALPDLMFRLGRDGTYLDFAGSEADLVAPWSELAGRKIDEVLPPEPAGRIMRCLRRVLERGVGVESVEYQLRLGSLNRHFEGRLVASARDEALLIVRDISERKRAEAQLQRLQDELRARFDELQRERDFIRAVVQAAPSFFCLVDPEGRIVVLNRTLERASGYADDDGVRGRVFWEVFVAAGECEGACQTFARAVATRSRAEHENYWVSAAGDRLLVAWSVTPILDQRGEQRFLITGMDITDRKRHEEELRKSRARIVEAGATERRRLERNLHDGAQQRLVAISVSLRLAHAKIRSDSEGAEKLLAGASDELARATEELRELARGIHPAILTDRGLEPALQALVARTPLPVTLAEAPDERLPEPVEAAAYYVVSEALANMSKYAQASAATVRVSRDDGRAVVEVADDGIGGADPARGSGLRGLVDRVEALDGCLEIESPPGRGTTVRAEIPAP